MSGSQVGESQQSKLCGKGGECGSCKLLQREIRKLRKAARGLIRNGYCLERLASITAATLAGDELRLAIFELRQWDGAVAETRGLL